MPTARTPFIAIAKCATAKGRFQLKGRVMTKRPNPYAKALRLGIYQLKKVPGKKGKGSYKRVKKEEQTNDGG